MRALFVRAQPHLAFGDGQRYPSALTPARKAAIAQLVEHVIRNDGVGGSNPSCGTSVFKHLDIFPSLSPCHKRFGYGTDAKNLATSARRAEFAQEVDEIIGEAVVVIDQDEHAADNPKK